MYNQPLLVTDQCFVIVEAGVNHNGSLDLAYKLVDAAKETNADAVKFQTFKAENVVSKSTGKAEYQKKTTDAAESQLEMIKKLELSFEDFGKIKKYCDKKSIIFLSTPFDYESVDFLESLVPLYKIGSGEITNLPFLKYAADKGKPIILSTGMSTLGEVEEAINTIINANPSFFISPALHPSSITDYALVLLHCTSAYPANFKDVNLRAMLTLRAAFKLPVGYSDHTLGIEVSLSAVALGAKVIEKHFTLDKDLPGPDHKASLEPEELRQMVMAIRNVEKSLGNEIKRPTQDEFEIMKVARRSLVAARNIRAGQAVKESDIAIKRPGTGILPKFKELVIGMRPTRDIEEDELFNWEDFK